MLSRTRALLILAVAVAAIVPTAASASELIDRDASGVKLMVAANGQALLSYVVKTPGPRPMSVRKNVLVSGAVNAIAPTTAHRQVEFKLDYSGGYGSTKTDVWKTFKNACRRYDGPKLKWRVTACKAPDGSYWAVQKWQRALPNYGVKATKEQKVVELRLSHWSGELPVLTVKLNWAYKKFHHIFGSFTYAGTGVHGFKSTPAGLPLDTFGRNLYVDTMNSAYGTGWKRENSFLMHKNGGKFCYGFYTHGSNPVGAGTKYRATIIGPGVTPDIYWESKALGAYDQAFDLQMHEEQKAFYVGDGLCKAV